MVCIHVTKLLFERFCFEENWIQDSVVILQLKCVHSACKNKISPNWFEKLKKCKYYSPFAEKTNMIITKMYLNILPGIILKCATVDIIACTWPSFCNFGLRSRRCLDLLWLGQCLVVWERRMTTRCCSSASLVTSTHFDFYLSFEINVLHFIQNHNK